MDMSENPWKTRNQLRRAHKLLEQIDQLSATADTETKLVFARGINADHWASLAGKAKISQPSTETIGMVVELLETRSTNEKLSADALFMAFAVVAR